MTTAIKEIPLKKLTKKFLLHFLKKSRAKFKLIKNAKRISQERETHVLDFLILDEYTKEEIGVKCKDWNRSISITVINSFADEIQNLGLSSGILVGERFSESAHMRADESEDLNLLTKGRMVTWLVQHGVEIDS